MTDPPCVDPGFEDLHLVVDAIHLSDQRLHLTGVPRLHLTQQHLLGRKHVSEILGEAGIIVLHHLQEILLLKNKNRSYELLAGGRFFYITTRVLALA